MAPRLEIQSLSYSYFDGSPPALTDISLKVAGGTCTALLGPTGAGKTTLVQILSGAGSTQFFTGRASGRVLIGSDIHDPIPRSILFPQVGYFMQDASVQLSGIKETVSAEIGFTLDNIGITGRERSDRIAAVLSQLGLTALSGRRPQHLSGGEIQRVALASLLVARPQILLLDEPLNGLDALAQQRLVALLRSLKTTTTILFTDSAIDLAMALADQFIVLAGGQILFSGSRDAFLISLPSFAEVLPVRLWNDLLEASVSARAAPRIQRILRPS